MRLFKERRKIEQHTQKKESVSASGRVVSSMWEAVVGENEMGDLLR